MFFMAPYMLGGAVAASIPIALHFFFRSRYRRVPWAAMKFLLTSIEQTSRRLRFQELLLLLARVAMLVLLALALARPSSFMGKSFGQADAVDAVLVIDNSYSMDAREGSTTRLEMAKTAALEVIEHLPAHSTVQVMASADRSELLGPRLPSDLDQARQLIQSLEVSHLSTDFLPAVAETFAALKRGPSPNKEIYLFSDMQKLGWDQQASLLNQKFKDVSRQATIYLVRCGTKSPKNVSVIGIIPQSGIPHTGERAGFAVLVRNSGTEPVRNLKITLALDGKENERESQAIAELKPGETRTVSLTGKWDQGGLRVLTSTVTPDELQADNRFDQIIRVRDQVRVLVVDGSPNVQDPAKAGSFFLMHALLPVKESEKGDYHIQPRLVSPHQAYPGLLDGKDICILVNVALAPSPDGTESLRQDFVDQLATFVREGRSLIIFGGDQVKPDSYNRSLGGQHNLLPLELAVNQDNPTGKPFHIDRNSAASTYFSLFRTEEYYKSLSKVKVNRYTEVQETVPSAQAPVELGAEPGQVILRYDNGRPALVTRKVGAGEVMLVTTSADLRWSDWPSWETGTMYVPFITLALNHVLHGQEQSYNQTAGQPLRYYPPERDAARPFSLVRPDGQRVRLGSPVMIQGRPVVTGGDTAHAGIYQLAIADESATGPRESEPTPVNKTSGKNQLAHEIPFAVVPDPKESENLDSLSDGQIDERLGFIPIHLTAADQVGVVSGSERQNREWTLWVLAGVLALTLGETALAWLCGRAW